MHMRFSRLETADILKAWLLVSLMFAIAFGGFNLNLVFMLPVALFTAGIGFVAHELAHKYLAQKYGCWAEFRANYQMLIMGLIMSFFGFVIAAPGAVMVRGSGENHGKISAAGPTSNIVIAGIFALIFFFTTGAVQIVAKYGLMINAWLAAFNLIPFGPFDGRAVFQWNKIAYAIALISAIAMVTLSFSL